MGPNTAERLGEAEQAIMEVLWREAGDLTAAEIARRAPSSRAWSESTVKTMLSRLTAKRFVRHETRGRAFFYRAAIARDAWATGESRRFLGRLFAGRVVPLVASLVRADALSPAEIAELEALLAEIRR